MTPLEIAAVFFGVLYVILAIKSNVWCWPAGMISAALYIVFDLQLKYYQDGILQAFYVLAGVYGWVLWTKKKEESAAPRTDLHSRTFKQMMPLLVAGLFLFPVAGYAFSKFGNAFSYLDAFTTVFSFIATYFTAKKVLENWIMWVILDIVFVLQYFLKDAYLTSGLYLFLTLMAVYGYYEWRKQLNPQAHLS